MNLTRTILAGIAGTFLMTVFMYAMTYLTDRVMKVVKILGTLLTFRTGPGGELSDSPLSTGVGLLAHYAIGVGFALVYRALWSWGIGQPNWQWGLVFGLVSGVAAIVFWYSFLKLHPKPPAVSLPPYLLTLFAAHVVFSLGMIAAYTWLR